MALFKCEAVATRGKRARTEEKQINRHRVCPASWPVFRRTRGPDLGFRGEGVGEMNFSPTKFPAKPISPTTDGQEEMAAGAAPESGQPEASSKAYTQA